MAGEAMSEQIRRFAREWSRLHADVIMGVAIVSRGPLLQKSTNLPIVFVIVPIRSAAASLITSATRRQHHRVHPDFK